MAYSNQLDLELAQRAAQGAVRHAATLGLRICVAVLDGGGHP
ncbi:MAG: hypothetical protein JWP59_3230, partial [Massilia sp.]|nr:hypothetical protein [Massilia sp.]